MPPYSTSTSSLLRGTKAAVFYGPGRIYVEEIKLHGHDGSRSDSSDDKENAGDQLLKVRSCCVCGYDARVFRNGHRKVNPPIVLGHEICAETTKDLPSIKAGTRVAVYPVLPCLKCRYCELKRYNLCLGIKEIGSTLDGGFAEYVRIPKEIVQIGGLVAVPDSLTDEEASLIEPLACCLNGFSQINGPLGKDSSVAIIGDGPMGLLHLQLSKNLLDTRTVVIGKTPERMVTAKSLGADKVFSADNHQVSEILQSNGRSGYDLIVVATSEPSALDLAVKIASKGSCINVFAGIKGNSGALDPNLIHYNQVSVNGSFSSTPDNFRRAVQLASSKIVDLSKMVTHRYSLDAISEAISVTESYKGLRAAVSP